MKDADPVKIDSFGTMIEQNKQLLLVKLKSELIRLAKNLREDTGFDGLFINPDLTFEQWKLDIETQNKLRELRQKSPLGLFFITSGRIVEIFNNRIE